VRLPRLFLEDIPSAHALIIGWWDLNYHQYIKWEWDIYYALVIFSRPLLSKSFG